VITFEWKPSVLYLRDKDGQAVSSYGIDIEVVEALSKVLNFSIIYEEPNAGVISVPESFMNYNTSHRWLLNFKYLFHFRYLVYAIVNNLFCYWLSINHY